MSAIPHHPERPQGRIQHPFGIGTNLVVPEADDAPSSRLQPGRPLSVAVTLGMLAAIGLDDQTMLDASEVENVRSQRMLAAELEPGQPPSAQRRPQPPLGVGHHNPQ